MCMHAFMLMALIRLQETAEDSWDLLWTLMPQYEHLQTSGIALQPWQVHNHCLDFGPEGAGIHGTKVN